MSRKENQKASGFTLIEVLIVVAIMGIVMSGALTLLSSMNKESSKTQTLNIMNDLKQRLQGWLETPAAWTFSIQNNAGLSCLPPVVSGPCNDGATVTPLIYDAVGALQFNPTTQGFDRNGTVCLLTAGPAACPYQFTIVTTLDCGLPATCTTPAVMTIVTSVILPGSFQYSINTQRYSFVVYHNNASSLVPAYSATCTDWNSLGWPSLLSCLQDGRWHRVFKNGPAGAVLEGSLPVLESHIGKGAEVQIVIIDGVGNRSLEKCLSVYKGIVTAGNPLFCLSAARFSGETAGFIGTGTARYGSDGKVACHTLGDMSGNGDLNCVPGGLTLEWFVRY